MRGAADAVERGSGGDSPAPVRADTSARALLGAPLLLALGCLCPTLALAWDSREDAQVREVAENVHVIFDRGTHYMGRLAILSAFDGIMAVLEAPLQDNQAFERPVSALVTFSAVDSTPEADRGLCQSFFASLQGDFPSVEFGILADTIEGARHVFVVSNAFAPYSCQPRRTGSLYEYRLVDMLVPRDGWHCLLTFDAAAGAGSEAVTLACGFEPGAGDVEGRPEP